MLAHALEAEGLVTVSLAKVRKWCEAMSIPRALFCEFPMGRPLGKPGDAAFQRGVLDAAFAMLGESEGPVLVDYPETINDAAAEPLSCTLPPRANAGDSEAVDEAKGLRAAYNRALEANGKTNVGRIADADGIPGLVESFEKALSGVPLDEAGLPPAEIMEASKDVMSYYEEAAAALADHVPEARAAESWFFQTTVTGQLLKDVRAKFMAEKKPWGMYIAPLTQQ